MIKVACTKAAESQIVAYFWPLIRKNIPMSNTMCPSHCFPFKKAGRQDYLHMIAWLSTNIVGSSGEECERQLCLSDLFRTAERAIYDTGTKGPDSSTTASNEKSSDCQIIL